MVDNELTMPWTEVDNIVENRKRNHSYSLRLDVVHYGRRRFGHSGTMHNPVIDVKQGRVREGEEKA